MVVSSTLKILKSQWRLFANAHPLAKGVISYAVIWPTSCLIEETIVKKNSEKYNWIRFAHYGLFGAFFVAPTLHCWMRLSSAMWPQMSFKIALTKALIEQVSYIPFASTSFFFTMCLLEGGTTKEAVQEVSEKFPKAFKMGLWYWSIMQTINHSMVPEKHRISVVSICSLVWTTYLAYMQSEHLHEGEQTFPIQQKELLQVAHYVN